ncbi:MAG: DUF1559 domain-containing protein, partial [Planctomycetota bacterium]|nr:DUF1559 domain-containing protein [Planctomycetota bacterium]
MRTFIATQSASKRSSRAQESGFSLMEMTVGMGIIALLIAVLLPAISVVREKARVLTCIGNLQQITVGLNMYKSAFLRYPQEPLGDFRPLAGFIQENDLFECPSTDVDVKDLQDLNDRTSYRYFGKRTDLKRKGLSSKTLGDSTEAFDPADPGRVWKDKYTYGAVYDRDYTNHYDFCMNIVYLDDSHWERLCSVFGESNSDENNEQGEGGGESGGGDGSDGDGADGDGADGDGDGDGADGD